MTTKSTGSEQMADADLVLRTRSGDSDAFGELWRRHHASGIAVARSVTSSIDPDDLVQESYTRIHQAILKGGGPNGAFRAYLFTTIRNTAAAWDGSRHGTPIDELPEPSSTDTAADEALARGLTAHAFRSLPSRWQEVLWYAEIEQLEPARIAPLLGMTAGAVSQLTFHAREGLREAWVQARLSTAAADSECRWTVENLGARSRGNLGTRAQRIDQHLESCDRCMIVATEAHDVSGRLALALLPLMLGVGGAGAYLASLQNGSTPVVTPSAMPSSVVDGAVGPIGTGGASFTSGSAGATGGSSSGSRSVSGIGALVGAGSAALIVAGVVTAVAVVPTMMSASPATSSPNAAEPDSSSIASEVTPDESMGPDRPMVIEVDDPEQHDHDHDGPRRRPAPKAQVPPIADSEPAAPNPDDSAPAPSPGQHAVPQPTATPTRAPTPTVQPTTTPEPTPTPTPEPTPSADPTPQSEAARVSEPTSAPVPSAQTDSLDQDPSAVVEPASIGLTWSTPLSGDGGEYIIPVSGTPGATAQVWMHAHGLPDSETTLDGNGDGELLIHPNQAELTNNAELTFNQLVDGVSTDTGVTDLFTQLGLVLADVPPSS